MGVRGRAWACVGVGERACVCLCVRVRVRVGLCVAWPQARSPRRPAHPLFAVARTSSARTSPVGGRGPEVQRSRGPEGQRLGARGCGASLGAVAAVRTALLEVVRLAGEARHQVDLVGHEGDAARAQAQVEVGVEEVGGEQPLELRLVDLRRRHRVLRVRLEGAVQLREEVAARVEEEDVVVHEEGVAGADVGEGLEPCVEWVAERAHRQQPQAAPQRARRLAQAVRVLGGVLPRRARVGVDDADAAGQHGGQVAQLRDCGRDRILRAHHHRHVGRQHALVHERVARLNGARDRGREGVAAEAVEQPVPRKERGRQQRQHRRPDQRRSPHRGGRCKRR